MARKPADTTNAQEVPIEEVPVEEQEPGMASRAMRLAQGRIAIEDKEGQTVGKVALGLGVVALLVAPAVIGPLAGLVASKTVAAGAISALATRYYYKRKYGE